MNDKNDSHWLDSYIAMTDRALKLESELEELKRQVRLTLTENRHLADGEQCTLKRLKDAIGFDFPPEGADVDLALL